MLQIGVRFSCQLLFLSHKLVGEIVKNKPQNHLFCVRWPFCTVLVIDCTHGYYEKKDHFLSALVKILKLKKQIRYKRQIRDTLHAYTKRYIVTK